MAIIIDLNINEPLANNLAKLLNGNYCHIKTTEFSCQEFQLSFDSFNIASGSEEIFIVAAGNCDIHKTLFKISMVCDLLRNLHYHKINLIIPYLYYNRQNKLQQNISNGKNVILSFLNSLNLQKIISLDIHNEDKINSGNTINLSALTLLAQNALNHYNHKNDLCFVAADQGIYKPVKKLAQYFNVSFAALSKSRTSNKIIMHLVEGDVKEKNCIIFDDILDSGVTLLEAIKIIKKLQCKSISAAVTHAFFNNKNYSHEIINLLDELHIAHNMSSDLNLIFSKNQLLRLHTINIAPIFAE